MINLEQAMETTPRRSSRKRALFPDSSVGSENSLGHMSPIWSSPDRYSSAAASPSPSKCSPDFKNKGKESSSLELFKNLMETRKFAITSPKRYMNEITNSSKSPSSDSDTVSNNNSFLVNRPKGLKTPVKGSRKNLLLEFKDSVSNESMTSKQNDKQEHRSPSKAFKRSISDILKNCFYGKKPTTDILANKKDVGQGVKRMRCPSADSTKTYKSISGKSRQKYKQVSAAKRRKLGEINVGVWHNIKKPKKKKLPPVKNAFKVPKITPEARILSYLDNTSLKDVMDNSKKNVHKIADVKKLETTPKKKINVTVMPSPPSDPNKKFFKRNQTLAINRQATVTVNNIKIKVSNGKLSLDEKHSYPKSKNQSGLKDNDKPSEVEFEPIEDENSQTESVQDMVKESVQMILNDLDDDKTDTGCSTNDTSIIKPSNEDGDDGTIVNTVLFSDASQDTTSAPVIVPGSVVSLASLTSPARKMFPIFYKDHNEKMNDTTPNSAGSKSSIVSKWKPLAKDQTQIDVGQKNFGATICKECGTVYQLGDPDDEVAHYNFHNNISNLKYNPRKTERAVRWYTTGRVIVVYPDDPKVWRKTVENVLEVVDQELGFVDPDFETLQHSKVYLYVNDKSIMGCLVAEPKESAYKMLSSVGEIECCSTEVYPIRCGISRIWTAPNSRRKRVATSLLDCMRTTFMFDHFLRMDEFAFSVPTTIGKLFAEKYTGTANFLIYT